MICVVLDVVGVLFYVSDCVCEVDVGIFQLINDFCIQNLGVRIKVVIDEQFIIFVGFLQLYVLIFGEGLVI